MVCGGGNRPPCHLQGFGLVGSFYLSEVELFSGPQTPIFADPLPQTTGWGPCGGQCPNHGTGVGGEKDCSKNYGHSSIGLPRRLSGGKPLQHWPAMSTLQWLLDMGNGVPKSSNGGGGRAKTRVPIIGHPAPSFFFGGGGSPHVVRRRFLFPAPWPGSCRSPRLAPEACQEFMCDLRLQQGAVLRHRQPDCPSMT